MKAVLQSIIIASFLLGFSPGAFAGEMGYKKENSHHFRGFYLGGNLGGVHSLSQWHYLNVNPYNATGPDVPAVVSTRRFTQSDFEGGLQLGLNFQIKQWVFGPELGFFWTDLARPQINTPQVVPDPFVQSLNTAISKFFTASGRIGVLVNPQWLFYGKGGYANTNIYTMGNTRPSFPGLQLNWSTGRVHNGLVGGFGTEWRVAEYITLGLEYNYMNFDWATHRGAVSGGFIGSNHQVTHETDAIIQTMMARINFLFEL